MTVAVFAPVGTTTMSSGPAVPRTVTLPAPAFRFSTSTPVRVAVPSPPPVTVCVARPTATAVPLPVSVTVSAPAGPPMTATPPANRPPPAMVMLSSPSRESMTTRAAPDTSTELLNPSGLVTVRTPAADRVKVSFPGVPRTTTVPPDTITVSTFR